MPDVAGFLSYKDAQKRFQKKLSAGFLLDAVVTKMSANGRTCNVAADAAAISSAAVSA